MKRFDIVGIGQNAVDTLILCEAFPAHTGKERIYREITSPGGQVATAVVACATLGLRCHYVGTIGTDTSGQLQLASMEAAGIESHWIERPGCATQSAYIIIDRTGERTVLWRRDAALELHADEVSADWIANARMLHLDAGDMPAAIRCAQIAKSLGVPVSLDADTDYPRLDELFPNVDYLIAAQGRLETLTGMPDPARAIEITQREFGCRAVGITLGEKGALLRIHGQLHYSPGFLVDAIDTTGSGDVFHGALCYSVLNEMPIPDALDFANAMAALNCRDYGARGAIAARDGVMALLRTGTRSSREFSQ